MKFSKTISIEESHLHNIKDVMAIERKNFAEVSRILIGLGLQKYFENHKLNSTVTTTTVISESEKPPPIEKVKWDKVGNKKKEVKKP